MPSPTSRDDRPAKPEGPATSYHVIARPQAVAISWYIVRCGTLFQEIATSGCALLAMTAVVDRFPAYLHCLSLNLPGGTKAPPYRRGPQVLGVTTW